VNFGLIHIQPSVTDRGQPRPVAAPHDFPRRGQEDEVNLEDMDFNVFRTADRNYSTTYNGSFSLKDGGALEVVTQDVTIILAPGAWDSVEHITTDSRFHG
jgi:hypothetical protein